MFFVLSKILGFIAVPSNLLVMIGIAGIALLPTRFSAVGRRLLIASVLLVAALGVLPIGRALTVPLESRFPQWDSGSGEPTGIIVLGGAISLDLSHARQQVALNDAGERVTAAVELAYKYPNTRFVFSGGNGALIPGRLREADFALRVLENLGVQSNRIMLERESRNTAENAIFSKRLIAPNPGERWLLVTSAMHMPRAMGAFRRAGFAVEAYPVDYRSAGWADVWTVPGSLMEGIARTDIAVHEWLGLFIYWITGQISVPLPGP
jgi:uncharacterized SAM-binding protein YcdF (DUF218 family)